MSHSPRIRLIWAQTPSGVIGDGGAMPWHVPEDLAHFKEATAGHPVVMGRHTWLSFPPKYRPLPGRTNIVLSSDASWAYQDEAAGAVVVGSLNEALGVATDSPGSEEIWVIGGGRVYQQTLPFASSVVLTYIDSDASGDTTAPTLGPEWELTRQEPAEGWLTSSNGSRYAFTWWERKQTQGSE